MRVTIERNSFPRTKVQNDESAQQAVSSEVLDVAKKLTILIRTIFRKSINPDDGLF